MATITAENRDAWQELANNLSAQRPSVGKTVRVTSGGYAGYEGVVIWHGRNRFVSTRHTSDAALHLRDIEGRRDFRVGIRIGSGKVFVDADKVEVIDG